MGEHMLADHARLILVQSKQVQYVWMGTETAAAHADAKLVPQDGCNQKMGDMLDG